MMSVGPRGRDAVSILQLRAADAGAAVDDVAPEAWASLRVRLDRRWLEESVSEKISLNAAQYLLKNLTYFCFFLFFKSLKGALVQPSL